MLHVDEERIEAAGIRDHGDFGGTGETCRHAQRNLAAREALFRAVAKGHEPGAQSR
jgi:hypothetical protein